MAWRLCALRGQFRLGCAMNIHTAQRSLKTASTTSSMGEKMWITNAGFADLFTVFAKVADPADPNPEKAKLSAFLVERETPGLTVGAEEHKPGIRGSSTCPLILADCAEFPPRTCLVKWVSAPYCLQHPQYWALRLGAACRRRSHGVKKRHSICEGAQGFWEVHRRVRPHSAEARGLGHADLCRREHGLSHRGDDRCRAGDDRSGRRS